MLSLRCFHHFQVEITSRQLDIYLKLRGKVWAKYDKVSIHTDEPKATGIEDIIKWDGVGKRAEADLKPESWETPNSEVNLEEESLQSKLWKSQKGDKPDLFQIKKNNHLNSFNRSHQIKRNVHCLWQGLREGLGDLGKSSFRWMLEEKIDWGVRAGNGKGKKLKHWRKDTLKAHAFISSSWIFEVQERECA